MTCFHVNVNFFTDSNELYLPIPRRDSPVNEAVRYVCTKNNQSIYASCFSDGIYRYPSNFPNCEENPSNVYNACKAGNN